MFKAPLIRPDQYLAQLLRRVAGGKCARLLMLGGIGLLVACGGHMHHVVERGETLYSIGWIYGYDYREIAAWNGIAPPYELKPGQVLRVAPPAGSDDAGAIPAGEEDTRSEAAVKIALPSDDSKIAPVEERSGPVARTDAAKINLASVAPALKAGRLEWQWPIEGGQIIQSFAEKIPGRQGIDIAGRRGTPVFAAASGRVVYAGGGLVRYGKLIIVKHNETYLSAYAHNDKLRVKEGSVVAAGQVIAEMGNTGTQQTKLHFEIRRNGKPVDPIPYLPKRPVQTP